jgi:spore germination cell wall hydrolase CwlJ-like protein
MNYDQNDLHSVALCVWKEARGEGNDGMRAVMHVIVNRVGHPGFAHDLHRVVYGKNQFTSMSVPSDPEFNLQPKDGDIQFAYCQGLIEPVLNGSDSDLTNGAHYYANLKYSTSGWFFNHIVKDTVNHPLTVTIGHQNFYV